MQRKFLSLKVFLSWLVLLSLAGCLLPKQRFEFPQVGVSTQQGDHVDQKSVNQSSQFATPTEAQSTSPPVTKPIKIRSGWWHIFGSEELDTLVDKGLCQNADVRIALSRVAQVKARYTQASAGQKPTLSAPIVAANQAPGSTAVGTAPTSQQVGGTSSNGPNMRGQKTFQASVRADWRLDIWGEQAALADAAEYQLQRAVHERANVERNLTASIVANYLEYLSLNDRLQIADETESVLQKTLIVLERRLEMGDATLAEMEQQKAAIYSLRATIPALEQQRFETLSQLALLTGTPPGELQLSKRGLDSVGALPSEIPSISSRTVMQRPDILAAEAQLLAAKADIDVARARMLPTLDLAAQSGSSSALASNLFVPGTLFWNVVANLSVSIFDGGRRRGERQFSQSVKEEMVQSYIRTIYQATREIENAKSSAIQTNRRLYAHKSAAEAAKRAWEINRKIFDMGSLDYLSLLDTQRSYNRYLDDYQKTRSEFYKAQIPLFQVSSSTLQESANSTDSVPTFDDPSFKQDEVFWQIELGGIFHGSTLDSLQRDLARHFPNEMDGRMIRPKLVDSVEFKTTGKQAWYQVFIAKFDSSTDALDLCSSLQPYQQCRVITSNSDDTVPATNNANIRP